MAHHVERKIRVKLPASKLWATLDDFGGIERYSPTIKSSPIVGDKATGVGARRKCELYRGGSIVEEIVEYNDGESLALELSEHEMPLESAVARIRITSVDANTSDLSMSMDYVVKGGPFGWLMGALVLRPVMAGTFRKVMMGWAYHSATGNVVGEKLPAEEVFSTVLAH